MSELEMTDFEARFEMRIQRYAAVTVLPVDAETVAREVAIQHPRNAGVTARLQAMLRAPRMAFGSVTLLIIIGLLLAILLAVFVSGNLLRHTDGPPGRNGVISYQVSDIDQRPYNHLHLINPDGTNDHEIAQGTNPGFTADGKQLSYFKGWGAGEPDVAIMVAAADGSGIREITAYPQTGYDVTPDGAQIAMGHAGAGGNSRSSTGEIWLVDVATGSERLLVPKPTQADHILRNWTWSPDGKKLAYAVMQRVQTADNEGEYRAAIDIVAVESGETSRLTSRPGTDGVAIEWSPDGRSIVYSGLPDGTPLPSLGPGEAIDAFYPPQDVFAIRIDGTDDTNLSNSASMEESPRWSTDGKSVGYFLFIEGADGVSIAIQEIDDKLRPVGEARVGPRADEFVWSPDATKLLFSQIHDVTPPGADIQEFVSNLQVVDVHFEQDPTQILQVHHNIGGLTWQWLEP